MGTVWSLWGPASYNLIQVKIILDFMRDMNTINPKDDGYSISILQRPGGRRPNRSRVFLLSGHNILFHAFKIAQNTPFGQVKILFAKIPFYPIGNQIHLIYLRACLDAL